MCSLTLNMHVIFVEVETGEILNLKKFDLFPYIDRTFLDENKHAWKVVRHSPDLMNGKMHIYLTSVSKYHL